MEKTDPDHDEIKKMMQSLFIKLDALSNFHYTPKQVCHSGNIESHQKFWIPSFEEAFQLDKESWLVVQLVCLLVPEIMHRETPDVFLHQSSPYEF